MKREKVKASALGDQLRTFAAAYATNQQRERAEGLVQASYAADAHLAGTTTGIVDPIVEALMVAARAVVDAAQRVTEAADRVTEAAADIASAGDLGDEPPARGVRVPMRPEDNELEAPPATAPSSRPIAPARPRGAGGVLEGAPDLDAGQVRVLVALRQARAVAHESAVGKARLALLTEYASGGGRFGGILGTLDELGLIEGTGAFWLTAKGLGVTATVPPLPYGAKLLELWLRKLPKAGRDILAELASVYPRKLTQEAIANRLGRSLGGGNFNGAVGRLRRLHLVHGKRELIAADDLFDSDGAMLPAVNGGR